jgi:hypothetical protein
MSVLESTLPESAGSVNFTADIPAPPSPTFTPEPAPEGASDDPPAAPSFFVTDSDGGPATITEPDDVDELDSVIAEVSAELGDDAAAPVVAGAFGRRAIEMPDSIKKGSKDASNHVVNTPDVVVLIQGDAVASKGWPDMAVGEQRGALVTYLNILAGDTGAAPDVMFDAAMGGSDSLPESRVVRIRLSADEGSDADELAALIATYPEEWPVAVVTDDDVLAAGAVAAGATVLDNDQLLDLFD